MMTSLIFAILLFVLAKDRGWLGNADPTVSQRRHPVGRY